MVNALRIANWQRTEDATRKSPRNFPEPLMPPGVEQEGGVQIERFGGTRMSIAETDEWLGWGARGN